jgi:fatty acid-binding protein DegV
MRTAVITDSNSGIFKDDAERLGIHIIAMPVMIDGRTYYENLGRSFEKQRYSRLIKMKYQSYWES